MKLLVTHPELGISDRLGAAYNVVPGTDFGLLGDRWIPHDAAAILGALA